jgi:hypothetical protein
MRVIPGTHFVSLPHIDTFAKNNLLTRGKEIAVDLADRKWVELDLKTGVASVSQSVT